MIKTLKSELKLRPTYDEMIGMIEVQGDENRPSIETVIDRRATIFRNNQFGSQFDNIDFLGLKKQEEDRARENLRQANLRQAGVMAGTSSGLVSIGSSGFSTPAEVYEAMDMDEDEMTSEEMTRIRAEMERYLQRQREAQQASATSARTDLDEAHSKSLPAGLELYRINTGGTDEMPPLVNIEEGEEEEDFEDDEEVDETQQIMEILNGFKMNESVKSGIKFDLNKMNLNDWSTINPKLMKRDTIMTMFKIADNMGRLNQEQKDSLTIIQKTTKETSPDTPERTKAMEEARNLFIEAFHDNDPELIPADDDETTKAPGQARKHKEMIDYSTKITEMAR